MEFNEQHIPSRLLLVDHLVDAEEYEEADKLLKEVLAVNANQPEAWAFRAVMAHLRNDKAKETQFRADALRHYTNNPAVDQLIGRKLSQKYRFAEGQKYQRQALVFDANYLPARMQLAQDLLRLGEEEEGWKLVADVHEADAALTHPTQADSVMVRAQAEAACQDWTGNADAARLDIELSG